MLRKKIVLFLKKFYGLKRKQQIAFVVWSLHGLVLVSLLIHHLSIRSFKPSRPIAIRTITEKLPPAPLKKKIQTTNPNLAPATAPNLAVQKKIAAKTAPSKPKIAEPPKSVSKTKSVSPSPRVGPLKELTAAIDALESLQTPVNSTSFDVPVAIAKEANKKTGAFQDSYNAYLISYLQEYLDLPEYGAVKMELMIDAEGKLLGMTVISSENAKNSEFLKNRLPQLAFPCFNDFDIHEKTLTFTISFRNAKTIR